MEMYKKAFRIFLKHKMMVGIIVAYTLFNIVNIMSEYVGVWGQGYPVLEYTRRLLLLTPQVFILYLIITYEYFSEANRNNLEETIETTSRGYKNDYKCAMFMVIFTVLFINFVVFAAVDVIYTKLDLSLNNIQDFGNQGIKHIISCLFVNFFLCGSIAVFLGALIARIQKRITAYAIIMGIVLLTSYLLNKIATLVLILTDYSVNIFEILSVLDIMPKGLNFSINNAFGFSLLPNRISLILFWNVILLLCLVVIYSQRRRILKITICVFLGTMTLLISSLPTSEVDMSLNSKGSAMADQHYYSMAGYQMEEKEADFRVKRYKMELEAKRLLKAKVMMTVTEKLREYQFTFSHSYKILAAYDQNGKPLEYKHYKDELTVFSNSEEITEITIEYEGANEAFYANIQGINLPGSFPYYPVPGRKRITEDGFYMNNLLLEEKAEFDVEIRGKQKIYTNLEEVEEGHYTGLSTGVSIFSGIYAEFEKKGICIVYPYLIGWGKEELETMANAIEDIGYDNCKVFISPNMNRRIDVVSKEQIITTGYFESVTDLR